MASDVLLKTALHRLAQEARKRLQAWIEKGHAAAIAQWLYDPDDEVTLFKEHLSLRSRTLILKTLLCSRESESGTYVSAPLLENLHFQRNARVPLRAQTTAVLTQWFNDKLKENEDASFDEFVLTGDAWVEPLDISVVMGATKKKKKSKIGALLGQSNPSGTESLQRVGRCLDAHQDSQKTLFERDELANRLMGLLASERRQNVLIVGAASVGKTALLHEVVRRRIVGRKSSARHRQQVWLISPSRVISGMSYLGQWEERWLSILKEAYRRDHVLVFDDPIGLYSAGRTRDSDLCLADVLKAFVAEHPVRLVFEATHAAVSILRRRDRSLVDTMIPMPLDPMDQSTTLRTLVQVVSGIESSKNCFFHPGVLPKIIEYGSLVAPHQSFPGKAIAIAHGLVSCALKSTDEFETADSEGDMQDIPTRVVRSVGGHELDSYVEQRTGLRLEMRRSSRSSQSLREILSRMLFGQPRAVEVLSRYALRSIKGLQSLDRPLGVFLFLGPTGVGKTESAKALTRLLFLDEAKLLRIDMNEITSAQAAEQLIGTLDHPDGRLPTALRRQPNCVLLLDEIEKAHPDVLDYLLQVIGEGRLSDARGRLVDFRNAFIIMTSNLGATEQRSSLGFDLQDDSTADTSRDSVYRRAVQQFFRPEFLNRIDEIVTFHRLARADMRGIVDRQLDDMRKRDGLSRRKMFLQVDDQAVQWIIDRGYDPSLGARAVKRSIEREVAQPLADQMASTKLDSSVWTRLRIADGKLACETNELHSLLTGSLEPDLAIDECLAQARERVDAVRKQLAMRSPSNPNAIRPLSQVDYYAVHGTLTEAEDFMKIVKDWQRDSLEPDINPIHKTIKTTPTKLKVDNHRFVDVRRNARRDDLAVLKLREALKDSGQGKLATEPSATRSRQLARKVRLTELVMMHIDRPKRWILSAYFLNPPKSEYYFEGARTLDAYMGIASQFPRDVNSWFGEMFKNFGYSIAFPQDKSFVLVEGASVGCLIEPLLGTYHVRVDWSMDQLLLIQAKPIDDSIDADSVGKANDKFISGLVLERCNREVTEMRESASGYPLDAFCGRHGWTTVRGQVTDRWQDYRTGACVPLSYCEEWNGWILDQM
jgi:ATP-dependent Clp protease ATP-binding subunit ClpA